MLGREALPKPSSRTLRYGGWMDGGAGPKGQTAPNAASIAVPGFRIARSEKGP